MCKTNGCSCHLHPLLLPQQGSARSFAQQATEGSDIAFQVSQNSPAFLPGTKEQNKDSCHSLSPTIDALMLMMQHIVPRRTGAGKNGMEKKERKEGLPLIWRSTKKKLQNKSSWFLPWPSSPQNVKFHKEMSKMSLVHLVQHCQC